MDWFSFPRGAHKRRHGPAGYHDYESFREWLRDEFMFRCVYCLHRELWFRAPGLFHLEHVVPTAVDPAGTVRYANLVYACGSCNLAKGKALDVPDPCEVALSECLELRRDGAFKPLNAAGRILEERLRLNRPYLVSRRALFIDTMCAVEECRPDLFKRYMSFPDDLRDLRATRVPHNTKPGGVQNCYFALRERGELPETY